ncbi:MAG TPA: hypothetical protein VGD95_04330 [Micavibrio sp.]
METTVGVTKRPIWLEKYFVYAGLGAMLTHNAAPGLLAHLTAHTPTILGVTHGLAAAASYAAMSAISNDKDLPDSNTLTKMRRKAVKCALASVFSLAAGQAFEYGRTIDEARKAELAKLPRIEATTVIATKPITIADQFCQNKARGADTVIEYQGKKMLTMCPR